MQFDYDYLIIGGGLSGLSMAVHLLNAGLLDNKTCCILERRQQYTQDKSWCGWHVFDHPFHACVRHSWQQWQIQDETRVVTNHSSAYPYQYIPSSAFYAYCLDIIANHKNMTLTLDCEVLTATNSEVQTKQDTYKATHVFDARESQLDIHTLTDADNFLLQCFYGWHIKTDKPVFDDSCVRLMDFFSTQDKGIVFGYVLPFSPVEALIEPTYFLHHNKVPDKAHFYALMSRYLREKLGVVTWDVIAEERGILPMTTRKNHDKSRSIHAPYAIGTKGALLRPSTGYAFYSIQRHCARVVSALKTGQPLPSRTHSRLSTWMDDIFLSVCRQAPESAKNKFMQLFANTAAERVARFMHDEATYTDYLSVMSSMPKYPFIKAAISR